MNIEMLLTAGITLVVVGIALAFGLLVQGDVKDQIGENDCAGFYNSTSEVCQVSSANATTLSGPTAAFNATGDSITGVANLTEQLPTVGIIVAAVVIIGLLVTGFAFARR